MRDILFLTDRMNLDGGGLYSILLARGLSHMGYAVHLAVPPGPLLEEVDTEEVTVKTFPFLSDFRLELFRVKRIFSAFSDIRPDIVHVHEAELSHLAVRLSENWGASCCLTIRDFDQDPDAVDGLRDQLNRIIVPNEALREFAVNTLNMEKERLEVIHAGVDLSRLSTGHVLEGQTSPIIGMSCALRTENRVLQFPEVAERLSNVFDELSFVVLGEGEQENRVREKFEEAGLTEHLVFGGGFSVYYEILPELDIFYSPEPRMGLGIQIMEAMGCAKPVVTASPGSVYHVIEDGETGFLVSSGNGIEKMADAIQTLLENPERAREMGKKGRRVIEDQYTLSRMSRETSSLYDRMLT